MTIHIGMEAWKELHRYPCDLHLQAKLDTIFLQTWTHTWVFATSTTKPLWNLISPPPPICLSTDLALYLDNMTNHLPLLPQLDANNTYFFAEINEQQEE
jgi:hypothetical protein